jgi:DDE superfamily endonuclease
MKAQYRYGEAAGAQLDEECTRIVESIKREAVQYSADCVYNMDETGKYWKLKPDRSLTTLSEHGRKKDKARITACLACNATGTDKLPIWFIGKAKRPHCFRYEHLNGLESIRAIWRHNDTAWMNYKIMTKYLLWFNQEMKKQGKHVLLLMDNFSAHEVALEQLPDSLSNTKVMWLPPNATSVHQPLDQGIIQNWKSFI